MKNCKVGKTGGFSKFVVAVNFAVALFVLQRKKHSTSSALTRRVITDQHSNICTIAVFYQTSSTGPRLQYFLI